ncbi:MAG: heparinase II/III family protein [Verrucomicrobia bacterium]|nr:heparinase II/III family protein [Verrucomicrobiota bacterium]
MKNLFAFRIGRGALLTIIVWHAFTHGASSYAAASDSPNNLSLARAFPKEKLSEILIPRGQWHPFPTSEDRGHWQALPKPVAAHLIGLGEAALAKPLPPLPATLYLAYARNGNRSNFEAIYFERRVLLQNLALAECVEGKGRFLEAAADALWAVCEESTWCLPAHVGVQKAKVGLPDINEPIVDLFAGETGVTVAWTLYLIGAELDRVSPQVRRRAEIELDRRILKPVFERDDFGWMALNVTRSDRRPNNWTPWISASVLTAALLSERDSDQRARIVHKMLRSLDGFLRFHPADGSCDEGPGYWGHAGGSLLDCLDLLHSAAAGKLDIFSDPLVQEIGRFIYRAYIGGDYFVPIGDCAARFEPERDVVFRYGKRIGDPNLKALAAYGASIEPMLGGRFMGRQLHGVFDAAEILASAPASPPLLRDVWLSSEDLQLMTARFHAGSREGLYVAAWGGHNAQSHNHNDVGNFLVFADGQPVFVDAGAPTYTAQTFSSKRYDHWAFQSAFHNLPTINGVMQSAGRPFAAHSVVCETNDAMAQLQMDIARAYPAAAKVKSWRRTVRLNRGRNVEITEAFELTETAGDTTLSFLTPLEVEISQPGQVSLRTASENGQQPVRVRLAFDASKLAPSAERMALTDSRLAKSWGSHLNRLLLRATPPALKDTWTLRLTQASATKLE